MAEYTTVIVLQDWIERAGSTYYCIVYSTVVIGQD